VLSAAVLVLSVAVIDSGGWRAGVLPRRTPRARRGREKVVVGNWMVTTDVVIDFAVRRGWGMALVDVPANHANIANRET
jgi:hypothetical protein